MTDEEKALAARLDVALLFLNAQAQNAYDASLLSDVNCVPELSERNSRK